MKTITLMLEWFVNPNHGPIIVAQQNGYFKAAGVNVTIQEPADPRLPPKLVAAGEVTLAVYYQPGLMHGIARGLPLAWVGTLVATPLDGIIVLENSTTQSLADLKGKTIGLTMSGNEHTFLNALFKPYGFNVQDVKLVNVGWNLSAALLSGQVQAIMGGYRNFELNQLALAGRPGRMFYYESHGIPTYDELIFIAHRQHHDKEAIKRFLCGIAQGVHYIVDHPQAAWHSFKDYRPKQLDNPLNHRAWAATIPYFAKHPAAQNQEGYEHFAAFLSKHRAINPVPSFSQYVLPLVGKRAVLQHKG